MRRWNKMWEMWMKNKKHKTTECEFKDFKNKLC